MIKAVLFDMDDTLLDINLTAFMALYAADMSRILSEISGESPLVLAAALGRCYLAMADPKRADGLTNFQVYAREFRRITGVPVDEPHTRVALRFYERELLPRRGSGIVAARPMPGGREAVEMVCRLGLRTALATNPSFSGPCIHTRMKWANISDLPFERVSHMCNSTRLKPSARYYAEFTSALGLHPEECLMVGNDARRDFPRPDIGMRTIYVGHARPSKAVWSGRMSELASELPVIVDRCNVEDAH